MKAIKQVLQKDQEPYRVPRRVQDVIPIKRIWSDGIFLVGNRYAKTFKFTDINYMVASQDAQKNLFLAYAALINSLDCSATTKITLNNRHLNRKNFQDTVLMKLKNDYLDYYRMEYNDVIMGKATGGNGIIQEKYVTVSVCKKNIEDARAYFARTGAELTARFAALGARATEMDATEKLRVLHDFYRSGEEVYFRFDAQDMMRKGHDFRDYICPDSMEKHSDYLKLGGKFARVIYLKDYASFISDQLVTKLTDQSRSMMLSIDIIPVATDEAVREVERKMLGVETNITNWQRRQNANNNFSAIVPYDMEQQRRETKEYMTDLTSRDQRMMLSVLTIVHLADTKAELDADTDALLKVAADHMCQMAVLRYQQLDGLNTALPIGTRKIDTFRTLTTESLAVFMPFKVQEIQEPGGIYFGENAISHNLILCNMKNLLNQSMMLLGIPGSGKSFFAKLLIIAIALSTDDDIIILDPEGEYTPLVKALGGAVMCFAVGGRDWLNAMAMEEGYGEGSPVAFKSQFIMSLLKQIDPDGIRAHHKSIIDRCVALVLQEQKRTGKVPTLCTLREKLLEQPEQEARDLALTMELYTSGSLNIFAHETNVDTRNRIQSYDIHDLGEELKQPGFVTITDAMINRVNYNWAHGKKTHIIVDEFHIAYENEYSGNFFTSAWRQFRKRNAAPCAITQNVEYMLDSVQASTMVSNSEFVVMLNQAESDQERLSKLLNISPEQMSYVNGSEAGCGLMRYGSALVPFVNRFPANTELYKLITTKPGEGLFAKGRVDEHA
ncbi:MAG: VirB4-like conjugal transfer ATPase, CD1110 family [Faecousia sp.]